MKTVQEILDIVDGFAPWTSALDWDNSGLQAGWLQQPVQKIICALDLTPEVAEQALSGRVQLIITHHPVFYHAVKNITDSDWQQKLVLQCIRQGISVISVHTPWDAADGGVNDVLAGALDLQNVQLLDADTRIGRMGFLTKSMALADFAALVRVKLGLRHVTFVNGGRLVHKVALCGGAGMDFAEKALQQGCDTFLTADICYHEAQKSKFSGLNLIDGTHQGTEGISVWYLAEKLRRLTGVEVQLAEEKAVLEVL